MKGKKMEPNLNDGRATLSKAQLEVENLLEEIPKDNRGLLFKRILTPSGHSVTRKLERGFALSWAEANANNQSSPMLLTLLSQSYEEEDPDIRERYRPKTGPEWEVARLTAATLVQWLGTPIGTAFLKRAFEKAGGKIEITLPADSDQ